MAQVGKPLDPWQQLMVMDTFGLRPDGYWAAFECVGLVPRQNGKGGYTEAVELARQLSTDDSPRFLNGVLARIAEVAPRPGGGPPIA